MNCDKSSNLKRYDLRYASHDALNTKRKYTHVQSKVKVYIDNIKKEDRERRKIKITRHRSEPSQLADWKPPDDNYVRIDESSTDWKLVRIELEKELKELKSQVNEMKIYGDTMSQLLSNERLNRIETQKRLDALRKRLESVHSSTWSDPGDRFIQTSRTCIAEVPENEKIDEVYVFFENGDDNNPESSVNDESQVEIVDDNDDTILLESVDVKSVRKNMKYRIKKIFRCCTPCIKSEVA